MRRLVILLALLLLAVPGAGQVAEPTVRGLKASELISILRSDKEAKRRRAAALVLADIPADWRKHIPALAAALKEDADEGVREAAAQSLSKAARRAHDYGKVEKSAQDRAIQDRDEALDALRGALKTDKSAKVREVAAASLGWTGAEAKEGDKEPEKSIVAACKVSVPYLIDALKDPDPGPRRAAAEGLSLLADFARDAVPALVEVLKDRKAELLTRNFAAAAIGRIGGSAAQDAVPALAEVLTDADSSVELRRSAAEALGALKGNAGGAVPALGKALKDKSVVVRRAAITALGKVGDDAHAALPALKEAARDEDKFVRANVMAILGAFPDDAAEVVPVLTAALKDALQEVRLAAVEALGKLGPAAKAALPALQAATRDSATAVRDAAQEAIKKVQPNP